MNISVQVYAVKQPVIERVAVDMRGNSSFNEREFKSASFGNRFRVSVNANSTLIYTAFATKPSRKQVSRCIRDAVQREKAYQADHKAKFGWCRE